VPSLFTALTTGKDAEDPRVYGVNTNARAVKQGVLVEVVINNFDGGGHPMHLHGHTPQLVACAPGVYTTRWEHPNQLNLAGAIALISSLGYNGDTGGMPKIPMRRDTWVIAPKGYTVI
jgi:iron transport multicopper oxidase